MKQIIEAVVAMLRNKFLAHFRHRVALLNRDRFARIARRSTDDLSACAGVEFVCLFLICDNAGSHG